MKRIFKVAVCLTIAAGLMLPVAVQAKQGDSGYEGGISSGEAPGKTSMQYQEVSFITGEPIVFEGTLVIKKSAKQDQATTTYTYNLKNTQRQATLTRTLIYSTAITKKANGQTVEETILTGKPSEVIRMAGEVYTMQNYDFSKSNIIDPKPAVNYFAGNTWGRKTYRAGTTGAAITVEATGNYYGYDQYWGTAEAQTINYVIEAENATDGQTEAWGGTATVTVSSTTSKNVKYVENEPQVISFEGGFVQSQFNSSIMEYTARLPEFDSKGVATDYILETTDTLKLESFPQQTRLPVADISHLRGHWAEQDIKTMYSLEIFKEDSTTLNPDEYITKSEFIAAMVEAAKEVSTETTTTTRTPTGTKSKKEVVVSPFTDVPVDSKYYTQIESAYKRGIILGRGDGTFGADEYLNMADAITVFIKSIGLESIAPGLNPVTTFKDNDEIPDYARRGAYVAQKIGLVKGDTRGYLNPQQRLTKGQAAAMINRFISYMREDIRKDYRERIIAYR